MSEAAVIRWSADDFLRWIPTQAQRYELVDGQPMMMAGANRRHDRIVTNILVDLGNQLRGKPCQPFTGDTAIAISSGNIRYPDAGVDCGAFQDDALTAADPALVVEVLSPSTRAFDLNDKLEEYKTLPSLRYILLVDPDVPQIRLYLRGSGGWQSERLTGLDALVALPDLAVTLPVTEIYRGLSFTPRPVAL